MSFLSLLYFLFYPLLVLILTRCAYNIVIRNLEKGGVKIDVVSRQKIKKSFWIGGSIGFIIVFVINLILLVVFWGCLQ